MDEELLFLMDGWMGEELLFLQDGLVRNFSFHLVGAIIFPDRWIKLFDVLVLAGNSRSYSLGRLWWVVHITSP